MFTVKKEFRFEASHKLNKHDGKCFNLHGHSWVMRVELRGDDLQQMGPETNMLVDYSRISKVVKPIVEAYLDHHHLNSTLDTDSPTSEYIARWMYEKLHEQFREYGLRLAVEIDETCTSSCRYEL